MVLLSGAGGVLGYLAGLGLVWESESTWVRILVPPSVALAVWGAVMALSLMIVEGAGWAASTLCGPSGSSTPRRLEHSRAEALAARGHYREALVAYEVAALEHPDDPTPRVRMARIHRDSLGEPEEAIRCFRQARENPGVAEGQWRAISRELIEVFTGSLAQPVRAAPELARLAERASGTPEGEWAARELHRVKLLLDDPGRS